jgi:hypothetical protein
MVTLQTISGTQTEKIIIQKWASKTYLKTLERMIL